jgi:hypothetical protein
MMDRIQKPFLTKPDIHHQNPKESKITDVYNDMITEIFYVEIHLLSLFAP